MNTKRKPTAVREREGNRSRTPIPKEPEVEQVTKTGLPAWFPKTAKAFYVRYAPSIRALSRAGETDEAKLQATALSWGFAMDAARIAASEGILELDSHKVRRKHIALQVYRDNILIFDKLAGEFGMSPSDRARLFAADVQSGGVNAKADSGDGILNGEWSPDSARLQ